MRVFNPVTREYHWINISAIPQFKSGEAEPYQVYTTFEDITESKEFQQQILNSKNQLQTVMDSTPDWIAIKDHEHRYKLVNRGYASAVNLKPKDMVGKYDTDIHPAELCLGNPEKGIKGFHDDDNNVLKGHTIHDSYYHMTLPDGTNHVLDMYKIPLKNTVGKVYGILIYSRDVTERYKASEELKLSYKKLQKTLTETVEAISTICEMRDPYTAGHQVRVTALACAIASEMGMSEKQVNDIRIGGILHDIGKIYVPAEILSKPGRLTETEFMIIKSHSQIGYDIVKKIEFPCSVADMILQHHERLDGSGYPGKLKGKEIIMEAKILAVADVVEAMSSHRPYRPALGIEKALEEIAKNKGVLYDEKVVDACFKLFAEKQFKFE
jgi:putative nucleotidyltransferase with HDIG domain/PAS domain S-box-containing protein